MPQPCRAALTAVLMLMTVVLLPRGGLAQSASLFVQGGGARPLIDVAKPAEGSGDTRTASLFSGQSGGSFFAPWPERQREPRASRSLATTDSYVPMIGGTQVERLRHLIASAEAGPMGYDAVVWAAKIKTPKRPTAMTVQEIYDWIKATPGQHHAIGRYQFIPSTLRRLVEKLGVDPRSRFSPTLQDRLADQLLREAGIQSLMAGQLGRTDFMNNIAKIWAGLPTSSGRSHYAGVAGNAATMSWSRFEREMKAIFPGA